MVRATVGKDVDGWCARCKLMLAHTVEAVVNGKITRTHCNTCGAQHAHRPHPPGTKAAPAARPRRAASPARPASAPAAGVDYAVLMRGKDPGSARPYKMSEHFAAKELIRHPTFGLGVVVAVRDTRKIDVGFADGMKTLAQGATAASRY